MRLCLVLLLVLAGCHAFSPERAQSIYSDAYSLFREEHYGQALARTAEGLQRVDPKSELYWRFRLLKAQILLGKREAAEAKKALDFELPPVARTGGNPGRYFLSKGFTASLQRDYVTARRNLDQAEAAARSAGDGELLAEIQNRQGLVAVGERRFEDARNLFRLALEYANKHSVRWLAIAATGNLGYQLMIASKYDDAIPYFDQAVRLAHQFHAIESEGRNLGNLGWCYNRIGDLEKSLPYLQRAEAIFRSTGNRSEQQLWLGNIGSVYVGRLEYSAASQYYQRALGTARAMEDKGSAAIWLTNLASISIDAGDPDAAERYNTEGAALKRELHLESSATYSAMNSARIAFARKQFDQVEKITRAILSTQLDDPNPRLLAHDELAVALAATGRYGAAEAEFRASIAEIERQRQELLKDDYKRAYLSNLIGFYEDYIEFLMNRGRTREALEISDSSHARTMMERLRLTRGPGARPYRAADFQRLAARSGSTLLSYSLGIRKSYLWVITATEIAGIPLPPKGELRPLIAEYHKSIQGLEDPLAQDNPAARKLCEILIAPAQRSLRKTGRAIIVPDGLLYSLNFETFPVASPVQGEKPHYWIEDVAVSIAPSLGLLNEAGHGPAWRADSILLIGDPVSPDAEFPRLAFAGKEMASIESSLPRARRVVLRGADAKPAAWRQADPGKFDLIHFAAHASANQEEPLESAVILSRDTQNAAAAYKLRAMDIVNTRINARLVTISACKSAGTRIYSGEGLVGLAWAFLESGAHNVIAGLWDVNDESGATMMARMYQYLAAGDAPADALREAKLELIRAGGAYRKPWYWGAFQLFSTDAREVRR